MKKRLIALTNGTGMGGELIVFSTNAPKERLQALEKESCDVFLNGGDMEDVPPLFHMHVLRLEALLAIKKQENILLNLKI